MPGGQVQYDNTPTKIPPSLLEGTTVDYLPLTHGCWEIHISATVPVNAPIASSAGLPTLHIVRPGQSGPLATAPPLRWEPAAALRPWAPRHFVVAEVPPLDEFAPHSMLLAEGDPLGADPQGVETHG